jgi:hypothetical protein
VHFSPASYNLLSVSVIVQVFYWTSCSQLFSCSVRPARKLWQNIKYSVHAVELTQRSYTSCRLNHLRLALIHSLIHSFIPLSVLRQVRSLFPSEFSTEYDLVFPLSISSRVEPKGCRDAAPTKAPKPEIKKKRFCRQYDMKYFTCVPFSRNQPQKSVDD